MCHKSELDRYLIIKSWIKYLIQQDKRWFITKITLITPCNKPRASKTMKLCHSVKSNSTPSASLTVSCFCSSCIRSSRWQCRQDRSWPNQCSFSPPTRQLTHRSRRSALTEPKQEPLLHTHNTHTSPCDADRCHQPGQRKLHNIDLSTAHSEEGPEIL